MTSAALSLAPGEARVELGVAAHEARHAAAAVLLGLEVVEARADNPTSDAAGHVMLGRYSELRPRELAVMTLVGRWGDPGWPPESPSKKAPTLDERQLAGAIETLGLGQRGYELMVVDAEHLVGTPEFKSLAGMLELLLAQGCVLDAARVTAIHRVCGKTALQNKTVKTTARPRTELGEFSAIAAAYSVDRDRDQIVRGAFGRTIERWQASDKRIPLHWNHSAAPKDIIGFVDPGSMRELREGLFVRGKVDLDSSTVARDAWRLMKDHAVSLSFGYLTVNSFRRPDGVKELRELDLFEISITPSPANPDTHILETKSLGADEVERDAKRLFRTPEEQRVYVEAHHQMLALLDGSAESEAAIEREEKRHARKLRRDSDRLRLELALGNPPPEREAI